MGNVVERVREICKEKGIAVSRLESDLGYGNGYLNPKKISTLTLERLDQICKYLDVGLKDLLEIETKKAPSEDGELAEYLDDLRERPETRALLDVTRGMSKEKIEAMAEFAKRMKGVD